MRNEDVEIVKLMAPLGDCLHDTPRMRESQRQGDRFLVSPASAKNPV